MILFAIMFPQQISLYTISKEQFFFQRTSIPSTYSTYVRTLVHITISRKYFVWSRLLNPAASDTKKSRYYAFPGQTSYTFPGQTSFTFPGQTSFTFPGQTSYTFPRKKSYTFPGQTSDTFPGQTSYTFPGQRRLGSQKITDNNMAIYSILLRIA